MSIKIAVQSSIAKKLADFLGTPPQQLDKLDSKTMKTDGSIDLSQSGAVLSSGPSSYREALERLINQKQQGLKGQILCSNVTSERASIEACVVMSENKTGSLLIYLDKEGKVHALDSAEVQSRQLLAEALKAADERNIGKETKELLKPQMISETQTVPHLRIKIDEAVQAFGFLATTTKICI